jgi:MFS family permease
MPDLFSSYSEKDPYVKRNFIANAFDGALFTFAMSFVSVVAIIPVFVKKIGGSNLAVGMIPVIWMIGFNFPQIFIANYTRHLPLKKKIFLKTAVIQRIPWLLLALLSFFILDKVEVSTALFLFFLFFFIAALGGSLNFPGWYDLISKITPVKLRGRLFAVRSMGGSILGIVGGVIVERVLHFYDYPESFGILFSITFVIMMVSYSFLLRLKEEHPNPPKENLKYKEFFNRLPKILKEEKNYRNYIIADALLVSALMADAFFAVYALEKFSLPESYAGIFTVIMMSSIILGNILFSYIADTLGHKLNLLLAGVSIGIASLIALLSPVKEIYLIVFVGSAFTAALIHMSRLTIIAELCSEEDRPTYVALTNMITAPFILSAIVGGWIATKFGYEFVFVMASIFAFTSSFWYLTKVKEPRIRV